MFLDIDQIFSSCKNVPLEHKHAEFMYQSGVSFADENKRFVIAPSASIIGIGGIPVRFIDNIPTLNGCSIELPLLKKEFLTMAGASAAMSYMNPSGKSLSKLGKLVVKKYGHLSILHTIYLNIGLFGISVAAEHEFDTQRDLIHLSRLTVARTKAQSYPSFVVLNEEHLPSLMRIVDFIDNEQAGIDDNDLESSNNLYPNLKAQSLLLSGTLKNYLKLCEHINDDGKEEEYKMALRLIENLVVQLI